MKKFISLLAAALLLLCGCAAGHGADMPKPEGVITLADLVNPATVRFAVGRSKDMPPLEALSIRQEDGKSIPLLGMEKRSAVQANLTLGEPLSLEKAYFLQVREEEPVPIVPISYFSTREFAEAYTYEGPLGVTVSNTQTFLHLWAPTATAVTLNLFVCGSGGRRLREIPMHRGDRGVWEHTEPADLSGLYYTYTVKTASGEWEAVDPYAVSAGLNGERGMILDLHTTDPEGWDEDGFVPCNSYTDAVIWETHVRDFSAALTGAKYKGKYLAFTETGLKNSDGVPVGIDYLKRLGITHVHLLPIFDFASVDEGKESARNWGYDPQNYNVPEGSYSTDPTRGEVRVKELKEAVLALHRNGLGVIMDVVYNHTYSLDSNFNRIVPAYYYRYRTNGTPSEGSGCGNETASERTMMRRFMLDSVLYWLKEYHLDGFRFDLMGLHDIETMQEIERAVHAVNPNAILYGEGWTGGSTPLPASQQASLANLNALNTGTSGIAMFDDALRDALKGSTDGKDTGWATGNKQSLALGVLFGLGGGTGSVGANTKGTWVSSRPSNLIQYVSAHDNLTLWDKICTAYGEEEGTLEVRVKRNLLCAAAVQFSLGIPFLQSGEEMLRTKKNADGSYNANSYNASDEVNVLRWEELKEGSFQLKASEYYRTLIAFRKAHPAFREAVASEGTVSGGMITLVLHAAEETLFLALNAEETAKEVLLPAGSWEQRFGPALTDGRLDGLSCAVFAAD